jgi:hypothetical protein
LSKHDDTELITRLLGRKPLAEYEVVVKDDTGQPLVIKNAPICFDGTPMPTLYWLIDPIMRAKISRIEAAGGISQAEKEIDPQELELVHKEYAKERETKIEEGYLGPKPYGGVGGTRIGVKCLHAHYAYLLAGGKDPVGEWVEAKLEEEKTDQKK